MGVQTTHRACHGSFTEFNILRTALAAAAGYPVTAVPGPDGRLNHRDLADADWETPGYELTEARLRGDWSGEPPPEDPLVILLLHSDWHGWLDPGHGPTASTG